MKSAQWVSEGAHRASLSGGASEERIYQMVLEELRARGHPIQTLIDVGCGRGELARVARSSFEQYIGCDLVAYQGFPEGNWSRFVRADLNAPPFPLDAAVGDAVVAVETVEHLENPRAFVRELVRLAKPGGLVVVTTPNQLSLLSTLTLLVKHEFNAFQASAGLYPAHITALLESDLRKIAEECGLQEVTVRFSARGRIPFTGWHWPARLGLKGRAFSDNVLVSGLRAG